MTLIDTDKLIAPNKIQKGDEIRKHYAVGSDEDVEPLVYTAMHDGDCRTITRDPLLFELIDRPRPIVYAKGTALWANANFNPWFKLGDIREVAADFHEGDALVALKRGSRRVDEFDPAWFSVTPPIELPTTPTLGRLSWNCDGQRGSEVAEWMARGDGVYGGSSRVPAKSVTEFVPGVFVPTSVLDALRHEHLNAACVVTQVRQNLKRSDAIYTFLADVDKAGEQG